jgi:AcrR family transcriptional regulator
VTRKPSQTYERLLQAGLELLDEKGFEGLKVRQVAEKAGVNLGMFHYHFKTKDEFTRQVLSHMYERFFLDLSLETTGSGDPLDRLRRALMSLGRFIRENRSLMLGLLQDAMHDNQVVVQFVKENFPRHILVLVDLVKQCQNKGLLEKKPFHLVIPYLMGTLALPNIAVDVLENFKTKDLFGVSFPLFKSQILSDEMLNQRIDIVLRGLGAVERKQA